MERDTHKGIIPCEGSQGNDLVQTKDRGLEQIRHSQPSEGIKPPDPSISDFLTPGLGGDTFLLFKPRVCYGGLGKLIPPPSSYIIQHL